MNAYARIGDVGMVENLMDGMHSKGVQSDIFSFNTLMNAYAKSSNVPDAGEHAEKLLHRLEEGIQVGCIVIHANAVTYSCAIEVWKRSSNPDAALRALEILRRMTEAAVEAETKKNNKRRRREIIDRSTINAFITVLRMILTSRTIRNKAELAKQVVDMMKQCGVQPDEKARRLIQQLLK